MNNTPHRTTRRLGRAGSGRARAGSSGRGRGRPLAQPIPRAGGCGDGKRCDDAQDGLVHRKGNGMVQGRTVIMLGRRQPGKPRARATAGRGGPVATIRPPFQ